MGQKEYFENIKHQKIKGINKLFSVNSIISPTATGPRTTPNCQPASNLANPDVLFVVSVISAILPPAEGLTALPKSPFMSLAAISKTNNKENEIGYSCANLIIAAKRNKDIAKPKIPSIKTLLLPMRSLNLPQKGLKKIQANAEIEKIKPT